MKIFISWSGDVGLRAAHLFDRTLRQVCPFVSDVWISPQIEAGAVGAEVILQSIRRVDAGLVIVPPQSQHAPWVLFEAGAFAQRNCFVPLLLGLAPDELAEPFPHFQYRVATRTGVPQAMLDLRRIGKQVYPELPYSADEIEARAEAEWPRLRKDLAPLADECRSMTRDLQCGLAARYINQAQREASAQRHRAEQQEFRANAFRSLLDFFLRYERGFDHMTPDQVVRDMRRDMPHIRRVVETEDFGSIEEGIPFIRSYSIDD